MEKDCCKSVKTDKLLYIEYFRGIAILFIVLCHTVCFGKSTMLQTNSLFFAGGTYFFVFIAGFLFWYLSYKFEIWTYYKKKLLNVICPYFVTLLPVAYLCAFHVSPSAVLAKASEIVQFIGILLHGSSVNLPLWFIGMIVPIFIISPFILKLRRNNTKAYVTIFLTALILALIQVRGVFCPKVDVSVASFFFGGIYRSFLNFLHFLFIYLLGIEVCDFIMRRKEWVEENLKNIFSISLFLYIFHFVVQLYLIKKGENMQLISKTIEIFVILSGLMLAEKWIQAHKVLDFCLKFLSKYSFGIFFLHGYAWNYFRFHTLYMQHSEPLVDISKNTLGCFFAAWQMFFEVFFITIAVLVVLRFILKKLGIKNTRMFIGV